MIVQETLSQSWQYIAPGLFDIEGQIYLLTVDRFSIGWVYALTSESSCSQIKYQIILQHVWQQSNGFIERHVKYTKPLIKKTKRGKEDIQLALVNIRATHNDVIMPSPGELLFGRPMNKMILTEVSQHQKSRETGISISRMSWRNTMIKLHIKMTIHSCTQVRTLNHVKKTWCSASNKSWIKHVVKHITVRYYHLQNWNVPLIYYQSLMICC